VHEVEDVGEQRGVGCLVPRQRLQQLRRARHHERQHDPVLLGDSERVFGGPVRRALVAELAVGEPGEQVSLHDRGVADDRSGPVQNAGHRAQGRGRFAFRQADHRVGVMHFA
jgi:hypothetical protein